MISEQGSVGEGTEFPLDGLLTLPDDISRPVAAVVMVHGSGPSNMDEKVMKLTPFKDLAEGLAAHGIASLRYDKRTFAHGRKMAKMRIKPTVKSETIDDAILAVNILKNDPRIDHDRIFILGHSMGAMLAPRIDAEGGDFRGLILMAGTPYPIETIMIRQLRQAGQKGGLLGAVVKLEEKIYAKKLQGLDALPEEEAKRKKFAGSTTLWYFKEMGRKTAADYLRESDKPVLILQGGKDFQVLPTDDFVRMQELLRERENVEYRLYEELNHLFVKGIYNDILKAGKEYAVERHIGAEVLDDIAAFVRRCGA
jgi:alpha-beta hydrolase superfamily lysophospholipase